MSLLERVIAAYNCRSMHHHIIWEALSRLDVAASSDWRRLMVKHHDRLFKGAKAPDTEFKDFKNHVLHVSENEWGGAPNAASNWYAEAVIALKNKKWDIAAYNLGVLSHYYADVCQPFHTGQTEEEGAVHRAVEWSICKSFERIKVGADARGYPLIKRPSGANFVPELVRQAAHVSHPFYDTLIDHYDLDAGVYDPPAGLDDTIIDAVSICYAQAVAGTAHLLSEAITEACVSPPKVDLTLEGYLQTAKIPWRKLKNRISDHTDRAIVKNMYNELQETGKVVQTLPDDDQAIRKLHARQVLRIPLKTLDAQPINRLGSRHGISNRQTNVQSIDKVLGPARASSEAQTPTSQTAMPSRPQEQGLEKQTSRTQRARLTLDAPLEAAPSIGPKTAKRFAKQDILTIGDFLNCDAKRIAKKLDTRFIDKARIEDWKAQTKLMMEVPGLRVLDVQILVGTGIRSSEDLAAASAGEVLKAAQSFLKSDQHRTFSSQKTAPPKRQAVKEWIDRAQRLRA